MMLFVLLTTFMAYAAENITYTTTTSNGGFHYEMCKEPKPGFGMDDPDVRCAHIVCDNRDSKCHESGNKEYLPQTRSYRARMQKERVQTSQVKKAKKKVARKPAYAQTKSGK